MQYGNTRLHKIVPVIDGAVYTAEDCVGGLNTLDLGATTGRGVLKDITVVDLDNQKAALQIIFFGLLPDATFTNNAAFPNLSAADLLKVIGEVAIAAADYVTFNARAVATVEFSKILLAMRNDAKRENRTVYFAIKTSGTPDYSAVDALTLQIGTLLD
ncbi:MAG TPA: hypothetical protein VMZ71_02365 [Gemmataceae bacterium]|nr:hypothetical protein [Gemmataceae bacterium]